MTALLTDIAGGRRFWLRAPQGAARPYVIMQRAGSTPTYHMRGATGLVPSRLQIDVYAETFTEAKDVATEIEALVSGYSSGPVQGIFIESIRDLPAADAGNVASLFRKSIDITVHYGEPS